MLAHDLPLFREDKGEMQEGGRGQIPAEQEQVREDLCGLKIKDGHEETKPDHTEAQKAPTPLGVRTQQKDQRSQAELPQRHQQRQAKLHDQPSPGGALDGYADRQGCLPTAEAIGQRRAWRRAAYDRADGCACLRVPLHWLPIHGLDLVEKHQTGVMRLHDVAESIKGKTRPRPVAFAQGQVDTDRRKRATHNHETPEHYQRPGVPAACVRLHGASFPRVHPLPCYGPNSVDAPEQTRNDLSGKVGQCTPSCRNQWCGSKIPAVVSRSAWCYISRFAQFIGLCSRSKWSRHQTKSPFLALLAMAGSNAAYRVISACSNAVR